MGLYWFLILCLLLIISLVSGQNDKDVRMGTNGVEIYYMGDSMWYHLRDNIDYREGGPLCDALSSPCSLLEYAKIDVAQQTLVKLECGDNQDISECIASKEDKTGQLNLTCMSNDGLEEGTLRQLDDGRILYLYKPETLNYLVWAHICNDENSDWDENAGNLFCKALGYENVSPMDYKVEFDEKVKTFGLKGFDCDGALNFSECTFSPKGESGKCKMDKVLRIQCENPITTTAMTTMTTMPTTTVTIPVSTANSTTQPTEHEIPGTDSTIQAQNNTTTNEELSQPKTTTTDMGTDAATENQDDTMIIVGTIFALTVLSLVMIGSLIALIVLFMFCKRRRVKSNVAARHHLSLLTKPTYCEQYGNSQPTADYLEPKREFDENYTQCDSFDEDIYETVMQGYDQYVPTSEERNYYSIEENKEALQQISAINQTCIFDESVYWEPGTTVEGIYTQMSHNHFREIHKMELVQDKVMGEGNFGFVVSGNWKSTAGDVPVAMKSLKNESEGSDVSFLQEAAILGQFNHPNVLKLLGMVTLTKPLTMVTELMRIGLKEFLNNVRNSNNLKFDVFGPQFLRFTNDIAKGMEHLSSKKFIHRDLSARNVLVSNNLVCKIADFGLARHAVEDDEYYTSSGGLIPLKWTSPEALFYKKYSEKSDVWSYGITLYEIWSVGRSPWEGLKPDDIIQRVSDGIIMCPPSGCPKKMYELMVDCWNPSKDMRPNFSELVATLTDNDDAFLKRGSSYLEQMKLGAPPTTTKSMFKDLQTKYKRV